MRQKDISRSEKAVLRFFFETKNIYTLCILPREEAALKKMGYNPKTMVCIERFDDESVFAQISVSEPVCVGLKDGGGKSLKNMTMSVGQLMPPVKTANTDLEEIERQRKEIKRQQQEIEQQHKEILARIEALEAKRKNSEGE